VQVCQVNSDLLLLLLNNGEVLLGSSAEERKVTLPYKQVCTGIAATKTDVFLLTVIGKLYQVAVRDLVRWFGKDDDALILSVPPILGFVLVALLYAGPEHCVVISSNGVAYGQGSNEHGHLGQENPKHKQNFCC